LDFFSAKPNQFFKKIINIGSLGNTVVNEKDISFRKKPEALSPEVFEKLFLSIHNPYRYDSIISNKFFLPAS